MTFVAAKTCAILLLITVNCIFRIDASSLIRGATVCIQYGWLTKNPR